jgi:predicted DNA-binding transcriptional regulator AlpA
MYEENQDLDYPRPDLVLSTALLERVDTVLLAVAGRLWELTRDTTPHGCKAAQATWPAEEMRLSPLGQSLLLIAHYAQGGYELPSRVERAMQRVQRMLFDDPLSKGYTVPEQFGTTDLGQLFREATRRMYRPEDLMKPKQVYRELGIARQSVYDRIASGKLHPIFSYTGEMRLLRAEVEEWKAQRKRYNAPE